LKTDREWVEASRARLEQSAQRRDAAFANLQDLR